MKNLALILISLFFISCTQDSNNNNQNTPTNISVSSYIRANYTNDARQMYYREVYANTTHPNHNVAVLDSLEIEKILEKIQAVYNLNSPYRNAIFVQDTIHVERDAFGFSDIYLKVNTSDLAIQNLANNNFITGNNSLDGILNNYQFNQVRLLYGYPQFNWLTITTSKKLNLLPVIAQLNSINSILLTEFSTGSFDGNNIEMERLSGQDVFLTFSKGWGDCPSGCIHRKYWKFKIINNSAEFISTYEN